MKKQYFADKPDYITYSILRHLLVQEISVTVCWMMTANDRSGHGRQKGYLDNQAEWQDFDPDVFDYLKEQRKQVVDGEIDVPSIERESPISSCRFYWECFPSDCASRKKYFKGCLLEAAGTDLVFFDPDIGPEPANVKLKDLDKYVLWDEIAGTFNAGHSVMVFNYLRGGTSQKDGLVAERSGLLKDRLATKNVTVLRTHNKDLAFFFAARVAHTDKIERAIGAFLNCWRNKLERL